MQPLQKKIRYGIIGFGLFAERAIAPAFRTSPNSELIAIQKRSLSAAKDKAKQFGVPLAFDSPEKLAAHKDIDAVFIVSTNSTHCPETLIAARAKKHVLVEKPMAMNVAECRRMIAACKKNRVKLMVAHMLRFSPLIRRMRDIVQSGMIGEITAARAEFVYDAQFSQRKWLFDRKLAGGGPVFDIGVHGLDTLRFVLDDDVVATASVLHPRPTATRTEDSGMVSVKFSRGTVASIYCSFVVPVRRTFVEFIGTKGIISAFDFNYHNATASLNIATSSMGKEEATRVESILIPDLYTEEISSFSASIVNKSEPSVPGSVGLSNQIVLDAAMKTKK